MESPIAIGDQTTTSINQRLSNTHLSTTFITNVNASIYSGEKCIQLNVKLPDQNDHNESEADAKEITVLRRVTDSYVNITQLLSILVKAKLFTQEDIDKFISHEIKSNLQYYNPKGYSPEILDLNSHKNEYLKGYWVPFDKAVTLAGQFDIYELTKKLFLVDVHDFDELPKLYESKTYIKEEEDNGKETDDDDSTHPSKKRKLTDASDFSLKKFKAFIKTNPNYPFALAPITEAKSTDNDVKLKFSELFKKNESGQLTPLDIKAIFSNLLTKSGDDLLKVTDIPLDNDGKTALHFAATLASINLVSSFIDMGLSSPIRGSKSGETPLVSTILVTNSMEKDNFDELLLYWLYPNIFLLDNKKWSFLHHLASLNSGSSSLKSSKYYLSKILTFILSSDNNQYYFKKFQDEIINLKDEDGNTSLHLAVENDNRWMVEILIELKADLNATNKAGFKPSEFDIVKEIVNYKQLDIRNPNLLDNDVYLLELIKTNVEFLNSRLEVSKEILEDEPIIDTNNLPPVSDKPSDEFTATNRLLQSINGLLQNTNNEYESILNGKKKQINSLNQQLYDTSLITTNNKFLHRKINDKLIYLDNLKLQMSNITEKLELLKQELPKQDADSEEETFDADDPFRIESIYTKVSNNEPIDGLKSNPELVKLLPDVNILKARISSYKQLNSSLEGELAVLNDYNDLTAKFKKVVSFCTGVDINEVDELLDGLLEAVESQN